MTLIGSTITFAVLAALSATLVLGLVLAEHGAVAKLGTSPHFSPGRPGHQGRRIASNELGFEERVSNATYCPIWLLPACPKVPTKLPGAILNSGAQ